MRYAIHLITTMFAEIANLNNYTTTMNIAISQIKSMVSSERYALDEMEKSISDFAEIFRFFCPNCKTSDDIDDAKRNIEYALLGEYKCKKCKTKIDLSHYVFDWEIPEFNVFD